MVRYQHTNTQGLYSLSVMVARDQKSEKLTGRIKLAAYPTCIPNKVPKPLDRQ